MKDANLSDLLIQPTINTDNRLVVFSYYVWQYFSETGRSKVAYIILYQGRPVDNGKHVPIPVAESGAESWYNVACTV